MREMTVKELKDILNNLPDDMVVVTKTDDPELGNAIVNVPSYQICTRAYRRAEKTYPLLPGGAVSMKKTLFFPDPDGEKMLFI